MREITAKFFHYFPTQSFARIHHRKERAAYFYVVLQIRPDKFNGLKQLANSLETVVLGLNRNENFIACDKTIYSQETQTWRKINQHIIVSMTNCGKHLA